MPSHPLILGFDTSAAHCAAALLSGGQTIGRCAEDMGRGQAERLLPLLEELLAGAGTTWRDLSAIGVGVGPGNFTGIRIAVSAARGLALGLDIPAVGVSGCEARTRLLPAGIVPAIPAPRDQVYLCDATDPAGVPDLLSRSEAEHRVRQAGLFLDDRADPADLAEAIARVAADQWQSTTAAPAPLYARPADAAPSRDAPPVLLD